MSKDESTLMKGVAILLMLFLHLFNKSNLTDLCHPLLYVDGQPLVHILARAANPVAFFIILSGYGLQATYQKGRLTYRSQWRRIARLYTTYFITLIVFVAIGSVIHPEKYPGSVSTLLTNAIGYNPTYNFEMWFLLPYSIVSLFALPIFRLMDRVGSVKTVAAALFLALASGYIVSRYIAAQGNYDSIWALPLTCIGFLFCFTLGAATCRYAAHHSLKIRQLSNNWIVIALLIVLIAVRCMFTTGAFHGTYVFLFILLFLQLRLHKRLRKFLMFMGRYSMPVWMIHTYFCNYLFSGFIFSFRYPVFIYCALLAVSVAAAIPLLWVSNRAFSLVNR